MLFNTDNPVPNYRIPKTTYGFDPISGFNPDGSKSTWGQIAGWIPGIGEGLDIYGNAAAQGTDAAEQTKGALKSDMQKTLAEAAIAATVLTYGAASPAAAAAVGGATAAGAAAVDAGAVGAGAADAGAVGAGAADAGAAGAGAGTGIIGAAPDVVGGMGAINGATDTGAGIAGMTPTTVGSTDALTPAVSNAMTDATGATADSTSSPLMDWVKKTATDQLKSQGSKAVSGLANNLTSGGGNNNAGNNQSNNYNNRYYSLRNYSGY